jgi:hypothetical protein
LPLLPLLLLLLRHTQPWSAQPPPPSLPHLRLQLRTTAMVSTLVLVVVVTLVVMLVATVVSLMVVETMVMTVLMAAWALGFAISFHTISCRATSSHMSSFHTTIIRR